MQKRHMDREAYFNEQVTTSRKYYLGYIEKHLTLQPGVRVLEIGCGEGGNLIPFAGKGCKVTGVDRSPGRIKQAQEFFASSGYMSDFLNIDFFDMKPHEDYVYDVILIHDVIEHIREKDLFMKQVRNFLAPAGLVFWAFPAWQMPFGGHQQICHNKLCSFLPFFHLLPVPLYQGFLKLMGESEDCINELLDIKTCSTTIERFEYLLGQNSYTIVDRQLWFINPHYEQKFGLHPCKLAAFLGDIRYIRNFLSTSCFYLVRT